MKHMVGIFIFDGVEVLDFAGPFEVFSVASEIHNHSLFDVVTIAKECAPITAVNGLSVNPHHSFDTAPKLDLLIIAGGSGTQTLLEDPVTLDWIDQTCDQTPLVASICSGARLLGRLGFLDGKSYCTHHGVYEHMKILVPTGLPQPDFRFIESNVNMYTSGGISAGIDLSFHLLEKLQGVQVADATAGYMEYLRLSHERI